MSTREHIRDIVERVRAESVCSYHGGGVCDCKFGASLRGEQTGCPELRGVVAVLGAMTDDEWEMIRQRIENQQIERWAKRAAAWLTHGSDKLTEKQIHSMLDPEPSAPEGAPSVTLAGSPSTKPVRVPGR